MMRAHTVWAGCAAAVLLAAPGVSYAAAAAGAAGGGGYVVANAARVQDKAALRALIRQKADVNAVMPDGATALHWAAHWDDLESASLLLKAGANVNAKNDYDVTP